MEDSEGSERVIEGSLLLYLTQTDTRTSSETPHTLSVTFFLSEGMQ